MDKGRISLLFTVSITQNKPDFKYNGKELDQMHDLNQYDYAARYYDPAISRFTSVDPLAEKYYSISPYVYVANNPMRFIDPTGQSYGWFVNNENGNMVFIKGAKEITNEHREKYNLGNAKYEN